MTPDLGSGNRKFKSCLSDMKIIYNEKEFEMVGEDSEGNIFIWDGLRPIIYTPIKKETPQEPPISTIVPKEDESTHST